MKDVQEHTKFEAPKADPSVYIRYGQCRGYILVYVADCIIVTRCRSEAATLIRGLKANFDIRVEENVTTFLRILFEQTKGPIYIQNSALISQLLHRRSLETALPVRRPLPQFISLSNYGCPEQHGTPDQEKYMAVAKYEQILAIFLYLAKTVHPDMASSTSLLSRYISNPGSKHWQCAGHVLKYLSGTRRGGIVFESHRSPEVVLYADSYYAGFKDTRKYTSGFVFIPNDSLMARRSKTQNTVAQNYIESRVYISFICCSGINVDSKAI